MDPTLIGPTSPLGYPAPFWFVQFFKVLGFMLHMVPMNLWYAGLILSAIVFWRGGVHGQRLATRLVSAMPIVVALGVNLGIVPLLFTQVAYYRVFYPATILMAWPWFSIFGLLIVGYYGVYIYVDSLRNNGLRSPVNRLTPLKRAVGWVAALVFISIGFLFANGMSLMANVGRWPDILAATDQAGAVSGLALNIGDPTLWPRWLMMFGLALTTTAAYIVVDTGFFAGKESAAYRQWALRLALIVYSVGLVWFAVMGTWYIFSIWNMRAALFDGPVAILTVLTAVAPGLPWLLIFRQQGSIAKVQAVLVGVAQFGVVAFNALSRQVVQSTDLARYLDVTSEPVNMQWSPLIIFLVLFVAGLGVVAWMLRQVIVETSAETVTYPPARPAALPRDQ